MEDGVRKLGGDLAEKVARYRTQGTGYVRGIQGALGLSEPPRFELWFLDASEIREVPP